MLLVLTSILFSVPTIIAFVKGHTKDAILASSLTTISTLNHSTHYKNKAIQYIDVTLAHLIGLYYSASSLKFTSLTDAYIVCLALNSAYLYHNKISNSQKTPRKTHHKVWHVIMHISVIVSWSSYLLMKR